MIKPRFRLFAIMVLLCLPTTSSFASWFIEGHSCYVELEPSDVIMNQKITPVEESPHPTISIQVYDYDTMEPVHIHVVDDRHIVYVEHEGGLDILKRKFILQLDIPSVGNEQDDARYQRDLQYVMDIRDSSTLRKDEEETVDGGQKMMSAEFTKRKGCEKQRGHGRIGDGGIPIKVSLHPNATEVTSRVEVVAGWACGYEAVKLTHPIIFLPSTSRVDESEL